MDRHVRIRLLRAWYYLRELVGHPRRLDAEEFRRANDTILLAGSPWIWVSPNTSTSDGTYTFAVTNTTWPRRAEPPPA